MNPPGSATPSIDSLDSHTGVAKQLRKPRHRHHQWKPHNKHQRRPQRNRKPKPPPNLCSHRL